MKTSSFVRRFSFISEFLFNTDYRFVQKFSPVIGIGGLVACLVVPTLEWAFAGLPTNMVSLVVAVLLLSPIPFLPRKRPFGLWHILAWETAIGYCFVFFPTYNSLATADLMPLGHELLHGAAFYAFFGKTYSFLIGFPVLSLFAAAVFTHFYPEASLSDMGFYRGLIHAAYLGVVVACARPAIEHYYFRLLESQERIIQLEADKKVNAVRLSSLRAKTDPHFLFNTLNSICTLHRNRPEKTEGALMSLGNLFRYILDAGDRALVSLTQELSIAQSYLELEQLRFGTKLQYRISVNGRPDGVRIPALTIQTVVENAVKHGLAPNNGRGNISIEVDCAGTEAIVRVHDDGPGFSREPVFDNEQGQPGYGLGIVKGRLDIHYKNRYNLKFGQGPNGGGLVEIQLSRLDTTAVPQLLI